MSTFNEDNTVEQLLISAAKKAGWRYVGTVVKCQKKF